MAMRVTRSTAAIHAYTDEFGRVHLRPTPVTSHLAAEFRAIRVRFLQGVLVPPSPLAKLALALILLDGVVSSDDLHAALCTAGTAYRVQGLAAMEWLCKDGRIDRRHLSPLTTLCLLPAGRSPVTAEQAREAITDGAATIFPGTSDPAIRLYLLATAWASESLPGALAAHVLGLAPMAALPRATLARLETGLACTDDDASGPDRRLATEVVGAGLEIFHTSSVAHGSAWTIAELEEACRHDGNLPTAQNKQQMLRDCQKLLTRVAEADSISGLLLAWAADLVESGTPGKTQISPKTVHKYVRAAAKNLHAVFGDEDFLNWTSAEYLSAYSRIIDASSPGNRKSIGSALTSWHSFLRRWLDVAPIGKRLHEGIPVGVPAAEVIWPHEIDRVRQWLGTPDAQNSDSEGGLSVAALGIADERLAGQLRVAVCLLAEGRLRANELFHLRLRNLREYESPPLLEIEIAPMLRDGRLKTPSSRRVLTIADPDAITVIARWRDRRSNERALTTDFLFGDPHRPKLIYQLGKF